MLSSSDLVSIYFGDERPLPTELLLICLELAGTVGKGHRSMYFWVWFDRHFSGRPPGAVRRLAGRSRRRRP